METITLEIIEGPEERTDEDGWQHYAYTLRLTRGDATFDTPWHAGFAHTSDPDPADVLESMLSTASSIENARGFEDWAADFGYDTDSRKALATFEACQVETEKLRDFLGDDFDEAVFPRAAFDGSADHSDIARRLVRGLNLETGLEVS